MKQILSLVLIVAVIGFINAQSPPQPLAACTTYVNSTAAAFCSITGYPIANATDYTSVNTLAQTTYNGIITQIPTANDACREAVRAFSCQANVPKCGRYNPVTIIAQGRCDAVSTACNITENRFPSNYTTVRCFRNTFASIDGQNIVCVPTVFTTNNAPCASNIFDPNIATPATVQNVACPFVAACNTTGADNTCRSPSTLGSSCTGTGAGTCQNIAGSPGSVLQCLGGKCTYAAKRFPVACTVNEECRSNNCTSGVCFESPTQGFCTNTINCRDNLWCDTRNQTCYDARQGGEQCGIVQPNWSPVPCVAGFSCVRDVNSTFSYCRGNAEIGQPCSTATGAIAYDNALCDPNTIPSNGLAQCINNVCTLVTGAAEGQVCNSTIFCNPALTCKYSSTGPSAQGVCAQPGTVACDTRSFSQCSASQRCQCGADTTQTGLCAIDNLNPTVGCAAQRLAVSQCLKSTCKNVAASFVPYDGASCGATQCLTQVNAYFCCIKTTVGANYVAPANQPTDPCLATTTAGPITTGTVGPVPTPTPSRSGASEVVISFIAMIVAVVAFCL